MFLLHEILGSLLQVRGNKGVQVYDSMAFSMSLAPRHREMPGNLSFVEPDSPGKKNGSIFTWIFPEQDATELNLIPEPPLNSWVQNLPLWTRLSIKLQNFKAKRGFLGGSKRGYTLARGREKHPVHPWITSRSPGGNSPTEILFSYQSSYLASFRLWEHNRAVINPWGQTFQLSQ